MPYGPIEALTTRALSTALDAAAIRQQVFATNIANANTPGYVAQRASFAALIDGEPARATELVVRVRPLAAADGAPRAVELDQEVAELARNAVHQQALIKGLQRHLGLLASAASDGKR